MFCQITVLPSMTVPGLGENDWAPLLPWMLIVVGPAAGAGAAGLPLEPLEPPQFHDASATTIDTARIEDLKVISLAPKATPTTHASKAGASSTKAEMLRGETDQAPMAYCGRKEFTR